MRTILTILAAILASLAGISAAEAAIRLKPITTCPYKADFAFRIVGAKGERDGVTSEYQWLAETHPGWRRDEQALIEAKGKVYDLLFVFKGLKKLVICFAITGFFGKAG